jgi:hypothetical protein
VTPRTEVTGSELRYMADIYEDSKGDYEILITIPAWRDGQQWVLWCPFCGALHRHGYVGDQDSLHRLSHCSDVPTGSYFLCPQPGKHPPRRPAYLADVARRARENKRRRVALAAMRALLPRSRRRRGG